MKHYYSINQYYRDTFGCKVYKLALDGGFTCPNRDGTKGVGGCIFCSDSGSGDFSTRTDIGVWEAIEKAKKIVSFKQSGGKYIAYFQNHTNTYGPIEKMESLFTKAISHPDIVALSIGTRPDCLGNDVLDLMDQLNKEKTVFVELGLQTIHPDTAERIHRCYPLSDYDRAVKELKNRNINTVVHMILGLPGETDDMILQTAEYIGRSGANGIKFQLLHILDHTDLGQMYLDGNVPVLTMERYTDLLEQCIERIPPQMVVHRITGDGAKKDLLAPLWSGNKKAVLNYINQRLDEDEILQGSLFQQKTPQS